MCVCVQRESASNPKLAKLQADSVCEIVHIVRPVHTHSERRGVGGFNWTDGSDIHHVMKTIRQTCLTPCVCERVRLDREGRKAGWQAENYGTGVETFTIQSSRRGIVSTVPASFWLL